MTTHREYLVDGLLPDWAKDDLALKLLGTALGLVSDVCSDMQYVAATAGLIGGSTSPDDVLILVGRERGGMYRYPLESIDAFRQRLIGAADAWEYGGSGKAVVDQLAAAGYPGAQIVLRSDRVGPRGEPAPYLSQYWIRFPIGSYPPLVEARWGSMYWGFFHWGGMALPEHFCELCIGIVNMFGDPTSVFRGVELEGYDAE